MIVVENLTKYFASAAVVRDVTFQVNEGETLVLLGTSGCGKTTTLRMINRLLEPSSGQIYVNGESIFDRPPEALRRSMGYVLQNNGLFPHYTVAENIAIVPSLLGWEKERTYKRTTELLQKLHLDAEKYRNSYPRELSGGQQQRVRLERALAADPPILLMDEPFGALDPITRAHIRKEFLELDELKRKTIILVTHDVEEAFELGDTICLMDKGAIVQMGTPIDLLFNPANDFVRNFIGKQQMILEMKGIKLGAVWNLLEDCQLEEPLQDPLVKPDQSLWNVIQLLSATNNSNTLTASYQGSAKGKRVNFSNILHALQEFKQSKLG